MQSRRTDTGGRRGKFGPVARPVGPPPGYIPTGAEGARIPVYTPMTSGSYRARVAAIRAARNNSAYSLYASPLFWSGYGWGPYFPGEGFFADPFDSPFFTGVGCSNFAFNPFSAAFAYSSFANPFYGPGFFCSGIFSPALFGPDCPLCNTTAFDPLVLGLSNASFLDPMLTLRPPSSSLSGSAAVSPAAPASGASLFGTSPILQERSRWNGEGLFAAPRAGSVSASALRSSAFALNQPAPGETVTLVFDNGLRTDASRYWLGNSGRLHYVTASGEKGTVPAAELDMNATMAANRQKGVSFLSPSAQP